LKNNPGPGNPTITATEGSAIGDLYWYQSDDESHQNSGANLGDTTGPGAYSGEPIDFSNDHPFSFDWPDPASYPELELVANIDSRLKLFGGSANRIECSTCHDVHNNDDITKRPFLRMSNDNSAMCLSCHKK
jgi:predicted CXXCH cytochrome family protein